MKTLKRMFAALLCAAMLASFVACSSANQSSGSSGAKTETTQQSTTKSENSAATQAATQKATQPSSSIKRTLFKNVQDYINYPNTQKAIKTTQEQLAAVYSLNCYAEGNNIFVYKYTYKHKIPDKSISTAKENHDIQFEAGSSSFKPLVEELKTYVDVKNPMVKVIFCNTDGSVIAEKTFDTSILDE